ncbi:MAG: right-handed parallel beta-helix repeat-containing protein, partial [Caldilineaceae bacterium]
MPHSTSRFSPRRLLPIASALGLAFVLVWLLAAVTRPAQASTPASPAQATAANILYVDGAGGDDAQTCLDITRPCATIQRAIDVAAAGDTIRVTQGTYNTLNAEGGLSQVVYVDKGVSIEGGYNTSFTSSNPATPSLIDPASRGRAVVITGTEAVTLQAFTLNNGDASAGGLDGNGGCLLVGGTVVATLQQVTIENCTAAQGGGLYVQGGALSGNGLTLQNNSATEKGGAAYVAGGAGVINGGSIENNSAPIGGAVYAQAGQFGLTGSTVRNNNATDRGGALFVAGGTVIVGGGEMSNNSAPNGGGGGYAVGGALHLSAGTVLQGNRASNGEGQGLFLLGTTAILTGTTVQNHTGNTHAIYAQDSVLRLASGSKLLNNSLLVGDGGAIYASGGGVEMDGVTASGNSAVTGNGGVIFLVTSTLTIANSSLTQNTAEINGGAVYILSGTVAANEATLSQNTAQYNGGALFADNTGLSITGGGMSSNQAIKGVGGGLVVLTGTLSLTGATFSSNKALYSGGAIYGVRSPLTIDGGILENNESEDGSGGAIFWDGESLSASGGLILRGNKADEQPVSARSRQGSRAIVDDPVAYLRARATAISPDTPGWMSSPGSGLASTEGFTSGDINRVMEVAVGAVPVPEPTAGHLTPSVPPIQPSRMGARSTSATLPVTTFHTISVTASSGGAIYVVDAAVVMDGATVEQNKAGRAGGGLFVEGGSLTVDGGGSYSQNEAQFSAGGALAITGTFVAITNTTFSTNKAQNGGAVYAISSTLTANMSSLTGNTSIVDGGAFYFGDSAISVADNMIKQNLSDRGGGIFLRGGTATITRNTIEENNTSFRRAILLNQATGIGVGVFISGTKEVSFTYNLVAKNTMPYRIEKVQVGYITDTVIFNETNPPTIIAPGPIYEDRVTADNGGGLFMKRGDGVFLNNTFLSNSASLHGGGLFFEDSTISLVNNVVAQNSVAVSTSLGSALYFSGTTVSLVHNTIADNLHTHAQGPFGRNVAIFLLGQGNQVTMLNNIIANHDIGAKGDEGAQITGGGNVWFGNKVRPWTTDLFPVETVHILKDPKFVNAASGDYHIQRDSAAYSAGVSTMDALGYEVLTDADGQPRSAPPDAGAFEHRYNRGLNIAQSADPLALNKDMTLRYAITVTNNSFSSIAGVQFSDVLPPEQTGLAVTSDRGFCNLSGLSCDLGTLAVGDVAVVNIEAQVTGAPVPGKLVTMTNVVNLNFPGIDPADSDTAIGHETYLQDLVLDVTTVPTYTGGCVVNLNGTLFQNVQEAVDASFSNEDVVKVSGYCAGAVRLNKDLTIQGGWSTNMREMNADLYTSTLNATGAGTVISVMGQGIEPRVENLTLTGGNGGKGGGIYVSEASVVFSNVVVMGNTSASSGGGVYIDFFSVPKFFDSVIENNSATTGGSGVYMVESGAKFDNVVIQNNTGALDGGGVYVLKGAPEFANSTIAGHTVTGYGGGIFLDGTGPQLRNNTIVNNSAAVGGGVYAIQAPASLKFNHILTNTATASPQFILIAPLEPGGGGGIYAERSDIKILNNVIEYNVANAGDGAGIHMWDFRQPEIIGNVIAQNQGTGVYLRQTPGIFKLYILVPPVQPPPFGPELILPLPTPAPVRMRHNTFAENTGPGIHAFGQTNIELVNNIIYLNGGGGVVTEEEAFFHLIIIFYSIPFVPVPIPIPIPVPVFFPPTANVSYTYWGEGGPDVMPAASPFATFEQDTDISGENPAFQDPLAGDYHIKRISQAFQTGKNTDVTEDLDATPRNQGKQADIGADEYLFRQTRYASPTGAVAAPCTDWKVPCTIQAAIDSAQEGDLLKLDHGNYSTPTVRDGHTTIAVVSKTITIQGGYCSTTVALSGPMECDWERPYPDLYPSILGPSTGRGLTIIGDVKPEVLDVQITGNTAVQGGGMYVITATAFLSGLQIYENTATLGGGAYFVGAKSVLSNSQVLNNTAEQGGGVYLFQESETTIFSSTIQGNSATQGGGLLVNASPSKIYSNTISANVAISSGGGFFLIDGEPKLQDNRIEYNRAPQGGGLFLDVGTQSVMSNSIQFNSGDQGGGLYVTRSEGIVESNQITANVAISGGGLFATAAKANIKKNTMLSNTAISGGGLHLFAASELVMQENRIFSNTATFGGGLALDASSSVIETSLISANTAITGGGMYLINFSAAKLKGNSLFSNTAQMEGGGAYLKLSNAAWTDSVFMTNTAQAGGAVYAKLSAMLFKNSHVEGNAALGLGGGVYLDESGTTVQESRIYSNTAGGDGGGMYILRSSGATVKDTTFLTNTATSNGGGMVINDSNLTLNNNRLAANTAGLSGGAVYINKSIVQADRQMAQNNRAQDGAGMYLTNRADGTFRTTVLMDNVATGQGGALVANGSSPQFFQTTIARNRGAEGVLLDSFGLNNSAPAFINTIFSEQPVAIRVTEANSATLDGTVWHLVDSEWLGPTKLYTGTINIYDDPRFLTDGYHIAKTSPAVNNGVDTKAAADIDNESIPQNAFPDIGADEFPVECAAKLSSNPAITYGDVQTAVDVAQSGELIKLAGTCKGVTTREGKTQLLYLNKEVHLQGGYDPENWDVSYPMTQPTALNAEGKGRVVYVTGSAQPTIESVTLQAGNAVGQGGGPDGQDGGGNLYVDGATATFSNTIFTDGSAYYGGGAFLLNSTARFITNTFTLNKATAGGGLFAKEGVPELIDNVFAANGATGDGGGLFLTFSPALVERNTFSSNSAATAGGGAFLDNSPATILDNSFQKNKANSAAGVYLDFSDAQVEGNRFAENEAENAGGLQVARSVGAKVTRNTFTANKALNGAGLYVEFSDIEVSNNMVYSNTADSTGSGLYVLGSAPQLLHNTFAFNTGGDGSALFVGNVGTETSAAILNNNIIAHHAVGLVVYPSNSVTADANLWYANQVDVSALGTVTEGPIRLTTDPVFLNAGEGDFHLLFNSPAINVAVASDVDKDFEGQPRPTDTASDIGADEYYAPDFSIVGSSAPMPALAGDEIAFSFQAINLGNVPLNAFITATLPAELSLPRPSWNAAIAVGDVWNQVVTGTVPERFAGPLEYSLRVDTQEGVGKVLTQTANAVLPEAGVVVEQSFEPEQVLLDKPVEVRIEVRNVGNRLLTLTITDTLPAQTEPTGVITWTNVQIPSGGAWIQSLTITPTSAADPVLVNRVEMQDDLGFSTADEATATIGQVGITLQQQLQPTPVIMGEPFTLTVVVASTGDVAQQTALTTTIRPEFLGEVAIHAPLLQPGTTISLVVPYSPTSHIGFLSTTVQLVTAKGISLTDILLTESIVRPLKPTISSTLSGPWNEASTWRPARVPNASDVVLIQADHTVNAVGAIDVTALWNKGVLICPPTGPLVINASLEVQNDGEMRCSPSAHATAPGGDGGAGNSIRLTAPTLVNPGQIQAGDGGNGADGNPDGGAGGPGGQVD